MAFLYVAIGALYNGLINDRSGWEMLPHREFWRDFPALVGEGWSVLVGVVTGRRRFTGGGGGGGRAYGGLMAGDHASSANSSAESVTPTPRQEGGHGMV